MHQVGTSWRAGHIITAAANDAWHAAWHPLQLHSRFVPLCWALGPNWAQWAKLCSARDYDVAKVFAKGLGFEIFKVLALSQKLA
jgi:hypothetical protein